jgi:hypothetical protein
MANARSVPNNNTVKARIHLMIALARHALLQSLLLYVQVWLVQQNPTVNRQGFLWSTRKKTKQRGLHVHQQFKIARPVIPAGPVPNEGE